MCIHLKRYPFYIMATIYLGDFSDDMVWFRLLNMLGEIPEKGESKRTLYEDYLARGMIYPLAGEEETRYLSVTASDSRILQAFSKIYQAAKCFVLPARQAIFFAELINQVWFFPIHQPFRHIAYLP